MGHSGAGKTTLLDIIACNISGGVVEGDVRVNGEPVRANKFQKYSCYVLQRDVLLATATVYEALMTSALLRLPLSMPRQQKQARVQLILDELDLNAAANTMIGDDSKGIKGISGGERRRVSVGIGVVTDPSIIFLDEPTSGLDSETAVQLINCLVMLARKHRTVVCTIHQPNSDITDNFDDLLLLARGRCAYFGPWDHSIDYFKSLGYACPMYKNPSDYYMSITHDPEVSEQLADIFTKASKAASLLGDAEEGKCRASINGTNAAATILAWRHSASLPQAASNAHHLLDDDVVLPTVTECSTSMSRGLDCRPACLPTPLSCYQIWVLSVRFTRSWIRDPILLASMAGQYAFAGIFIGLMYLQIGKERNAGVFDWQASLWLILAVLAFTPCETACTLWDAERLLLRRETTSGAYGVGAFFIAKTLATRPFEVLVTTFFGILTYFMIGYQLNFWKLAIFLVIINLFQLILETLGLLCAIVTKTSTLAIIVASATLLVLLSFNGFLISTTPEYFEWIPKSPTCHLRTLRCTSITPSPVDNGHTVKWNIGILVVILFAMRFPCYAFLKIAHKIRFL
ncbi:hypothetical protein WJX72_009828 [[Myrmecia] bisecta]|uniref:ABC transporter domain-containing protein n=1 Tax=[Myrmecia] bisecta TaxID=41462 RepID=A0AAW1QSX0_9CHLO